MQRFWADYLISRKLGQKKNVLCPPDASSTLRRKIARETYETLTFLRNIHLELCFWSGSRTHLIYAMPSNNNKFPVNVLCLLRNVPPAPGITVSGTAPPQGFLSSAVGDLPAIASSRNEFVAALKLAGLKKPKPAKVDRAWSALASGENRGRGGGGDGEAVGMYYIRGCVLAATVVVAGVLRNPDFAALLAAAVLATLVLFPRRRRRRSSGRSAVGSGGGGGGSGCGDDWAARGGGEATNGGGGGGSTRAAGQLRPGSRGAGGVGAANGGRAGDGVAGGSSSSAPRVRGASSLSPRLMGT